MLLVIDFTNKPVARTYLWCKSQRAVNIGGLTSQILQCTLRDFWWETKIYVAAARVDSELKQTNEDMHWKGKYISTLQ